MVINMLLISGELILNEQTISGRTHKPFKPFSLQLKSRTWIQFNFETGSILIKFWNLKFSKPPSKLNRSYSNLNSTLQSSESTDRFACSNDNQQIIFWFKFFEVSKYPKILSCKIPFVSHQKECTVWGEHSSDLKKEVLKKRFCKPSPKTSVTKLRERTSFQTERLSV